MDRERFTSFCRAHKWAIVCLLCGLVLAILLLTIGFWRTLLLFAILAVCWLLGMLLDKNGVEGVKAFFKKIFGADD